MSVVVVYVGMSQQSAWLNELAKRNMYGMVVTRLVFQLPIGWLNALARKNMAIMSVTAAVFQLPIGWLNVDLPLKR
jgi:hypothetical protein